MFKFFRKQKQPDYIAQVTEYINSVYIEHEEYAGSGIKYSVRVWDESEEDYDFDEVCCAMVQYFRTGATEDLIAELEKARRKTFTETLMWYIAKTGKTDSAIYNSALMDRRLFSKIMSDRNYKPSKDTAIALVLALHLNLEQAEDLLKRAGYSLSHSNKRDIVIEYFIREEMYDLMVINDVLHKLEEKKIGR